MSYQSVNPYDGTVLKTFDEFTDGQLGVIGEDARAELNLSASLVDPLAHLSRYQARKFRNLRVHQCGHFGHDVRPLGECRVPPGLEAGLGGSNSRVESAERFLAPLKLHPAVGEAHMENSPIDVIFCVEPWNFPYYQLARVAGPQLMAGNVLLVKHASNVPQCAIAFEKLWVEAGAPAGLYTNLLITHDQAGRVVDDPRVKGVALTGSAAAGRRIAARAGQNLKPSSLELGGSDAFIVMEDADLDDTVKWAVWGRMYNTGQTCVAAKRFIVVEELADTFLERFQAALAALEPGDPMDEKTTLGPLSTEAALVDLLKQVDGAVANGARVIMGGRRIDRPGSFMEPTILTDLEPQNPAFRQEFFGPVALFFRVKDEDAAVALANDSDFGLGGSVFTRDVDRGERIASRVETGMMFVNNIDWSDADLPFGGIKNSGYGRELGDSGIQEFVNKKLVRVASMAAPA